MAQGCGAKHLQVKMHKTPQFRGNFGSSDPQKRYHNRGAIFEVQMSKNGTVRQMISWSISHVSSVAHNKISYYTFPIFETSATASCGTTGTDKYWSSTL